MAIFTTVELTVKAAFDAAYSRLILGRDRETITNTLFTESVENTVNIAISTTYTVQMSHLTEAQWLYVETTDEVLLHFDGGTDDIRVKPKASGTLVRVLYEGASFTSLTIENESASVEAAGVYFMILGV